MHLCELTGHEVMEEWADVGMGMTDARTLHGQERCLVKTSARRPQGIQTVYSACQGEGWGMGAGPIYETVALKTSIDFSQSKTDPSL